MKIHTLAQCLVHFSHKWEVPGSIPRWSVDSWAVSYHLTPLSTKQWRGNGCQTGSWVLPPKYMWVWYEIVPIPKDLWMTSSKFKTIARQPWRVIVYMDNTFLGCYNYSLTEYFIDRRLTFLLITYTKVHIGSDLRLWFVIKDFILF